MTKMANNKTNCERSKCDRSHLFGAISLDQSSNVARDGEAHSVLLFLKNKHSFCLKLAISKPISKAHVLSYKTLGL